jgi:membrane protease YdiL (CAAX protease family)
MFRRLVSFFRSVIPGDPWHLAFLAGLVCLTAAPRLHWLPPDLTTAYAKQPAGMFYQWYAFSIACSFLIIAGAAVGYAALFWPCTRLVRRLLLGVCLPAGLGGAALLGRGLYIERAERSILESSRWSISEFQDALVKAWGFGLGVHFLVIGVFLVAVFALRVHLGLARLPLAFAPETQSVRGNLEGGPRTLLWLVIGPQQILLTLPLALLLALLPVAKWLGGYLIAQSLFQIALSVVIMGKEGRAIVKGFIRLSILRWAALGTAIPVILAFVLPLGRFLHDRGQWAAFYFGRAEPPNILSYLPIPNRWAIFTLFFAAVFEEIVFRGLLQTLFVRSYGLYRGIFLTCVAWAAFHFYGDASSATLGNDSNVVEQIIFRIVMCLAIGFVLSWLTIQSGSLPPPILAHCLYNLLLAKSGVTEVPGETEILVVLWSILAVVLFRYWPVAERNHDLPSVGAAPSLPPDFDVGSSA